MEQWQDKKARKAARAAKKEARINVTREKRILCPPDAAGKTLLMRVFGYLSRLLVIACAVAGLTSFIVSAFLPDELFGTSIGVAFLATFAVGACMLHPIGAMVGGAATVVLLATVGHAPLAIVNGLNAIIEQMQLRGYYALFKKTIPVDKADTDARYLLGFTVLLAFLLAWIFVPSLCKRARIVLPAIVATAMLVFVFTYNISVDNYTLLFIIAGFAGVLILYAFDRIYTAGVRRGEYDSAALLFPEEEENHPKQAEKAAKAQEEKERRREEAAHVQTVDEELTAYFGGAKKKPKAKATAPKAEKTQSTASGKAVAQQARSAAGGFAALAATVLAMLILLLPVANVTGSFNTVPSLDKKLDALREYVTAKLKGNDPVVDLYEYLQAQNESTRRDTTAQTQTFNHIRFLTIGTQAANPLYLTSWIGTDYADGAWENFIGERYDSYRELYGLSVFPSEEMYQEFFELMAPDIMGSVDYVTKYKSNTQYGFLTYLVNFDRSEGNSRDVLLPRVFDPSYGILSYRTLEKDNELTFANVFDGVCTGHKFDEQDTQYSVLARVQTQKNEYWNRNVSEMIAAYQACRRIIRTYEATKNKSTFKPDYSTVNEDYTNLAKAYIEGQEWQRKKLAAQFEKFDQYTAFANETYSGKSGSASIAALAEEIRANAKDLYGNATDVSKATWKTQDDASVYTARHNLVMSVLDYLVLNNTYTLEITKEGDPAKDGVENFLFETHEGYCVQFASAATLLVRELGIPARYVEGYLVDDYRTSIYADGEETSRYTASVRDDNKHAWMEVWYDGVGWVIYETTPPKFINMYGYHIATALALLGLEDDDDPGTTPTPTPSPTETPTPTPSPTETPTPTPEIPPEETVPAWVLDALRIAGYVLLGVLALAVLAAPFIVIDKRAKAAERAREVLAHRIAEAPLSASWQEEERAKAARELVRNVFSLFRLYGTAPKAGEQKKAYAYRLSFEYVALLGYPTEYSGAEDAMLHEHVSEFCLEEVLDATQAEEFGNGMSVAQMRTLAKLWLVLRSAAHTRLTRREIRRLHYIKRLL